MAKMENVLNIDLDQGLSVDLLKQCFSGNVCVSIIDKEEVFAKVQGSRDFLQKAIESGRRVYGYTSGFGSSSHIEVNPSAVSNLQKNLTRYHQCGVGGFASYHISLLTVIGRLHCLMQGHSGVSVELLESLIALANSGYAPLIPLIGSVGASGDLTPMSYIAGVLQGEGRVIDQQSQIFDSKTLVEKKILNVYELKGREALALMNGTSFMTAIAASAALQVEDLIAQSARLTAALVVACDSRTEPFSEWLHQLKPQPGQREAAAMIETFLKNVEYAFNNDNSCGGKAKELQDPYSIRCAPQVIGVAIFCLENLKKVVDIELNAVTDNPVVIENREAILHGGHFFGGHIASVCDSMKSATACLLNLIDRQIALLMDKKNSHLFPENLLDLEVLKDNAHLNHGFKAMQITLSALAAEAAKKSMPMSVFTRPTESANQDVVSMGTIAARDLADIVEMTADGMAIGALAIRQAGHVRGGKVSERISTLLAEIVGDTRTLGDDRAMDMDIDTVSKNIGRKRHFVNASLLAVYLFWQCFSGIGYCDEVKNLLPRLREEYVKVGEVRADFETEKTSKYVSKPLKSFVKLSAKADQIQWTTLRPIKTQIVIENDIVTLDGKAIPEEASEQLRPLLKSLQSLLLFKWGDVFSNFVVKTDAGILNLTPKDPALGKFLEKISVEFDDSLKPISITMKRQDELTLFLVKRIDFKVKKDE